MRQFKFRGYDKVNKRMFEVYGLGQDWCTENTFDGVCEGQNCWDGESFFNDVDIMHFTGFKDSFGNDIYESDIYTTDAAEGKPYIIFFKDGCWQGGKHINNTGPIAMNNNESANGDTSWIQIIGNIYEHPELLKP